MILSTATVIHLFACHMFCSIKLKKFFCLIFSFKSANICNVSHVYYLLPPQTMEIEKKIQDFEKAVSVGSPEYASL